MSNETTIRRIDDEVLLGEAAELAAQGHARLRSSLPFLPPRAAGDFAPRIGWISREGAVLGLYRGGRLEAFMGGFIIEDFRNAGPGAYCPDWCHGCRADAEDESRFDAYRALYRELGPIWRERGASIHAVSAYATDSAALEALSMTGFGRIVLDAARPAAELSPPAASHAADPAPRSAIRRALPSDAAALAELNARLALHIAAPPVFMPRARGRGEREWAQWFDRESAVAFVAESGGALVGYLQAEAPQMDVSFSVHGPDTLAIDGLFVDPASRGSGLAGSLVGAMARHALDAGKPLLSVDCETTNIEALRFWTRRFRPVTWSCERRT
jgi:ribosomal protein S18 acetylase RimI-like enzyme